MQTDGIFHNLVKVENNYSDLLCNLMYIAAIRSAFAKLLGDDDLATGDFKTQEVTDQGTFDIVYEDDKRLYIIEVKVHTWTPLTENQPVSYLEYLSKRERETKKLFFLVPFGYLHQAQAQHRYDWSHKTEIELRFVYWEEFYKELAETQSRPEQFRPRKSTNLSCKFSPPSSNTRGLV